MIEYNLTHIRAKEIFLFCYKVTISEMSEQSLYKSEKKHNYFHVYNLRTDCFWHGFASRYYLLCLAFQFNLMLYLPLQNRWPEILLDSNQHRKHRPPLANDHHPLPCLCIFMHTNAITVIVFSASFASKPLSRARYEVNLNASCVLPLFGMSLHFWLL